LRVPWAREQDVATETTAATRPISETSTPPVSPTPESRPTNGLEPTPAEPLVFGPFLDATSYRYTLTSALVRDGSREDIQASGAYMRNPPAAEFEAQILRHGLTPEVLRFIQVGDRVYLYDVEREGWVSAQGGDLVPEALDPRVFWAAVGSLELYLELAAAHQDIQGVDCGHYRADASAIADQAVVWGVAVQSGSLDAWVANDTGYLVRLALDAEGADEQGAAVAVQFEVSFTDVNQPLRIVPPPEAELVHSDEPAAPPLPGSSESIANALPRPPGAVRIALPEEVRAMSPAQDLCVYRTGLSDQEIVSFTQETWPQMGWRLARRVPVGRMYLIVFTNDVQTIQVLILPPDDDGEYVVIVAVQ
jgi:hypothetical protein